MKVDSKKIETVVAWHKPKTIIELRSFLGLMDSYRKFVKDYAYIARPLTNMLKKNIFAWNEEGEVAFETLKKAMITTLVMSNFEKVFELHMDSSNVGVCVVMKQEGRPLVFISKVLGIQNKG